MEFLADPQIWIAFLTLTVLELVLGIDNIIFISILSGKLPKEQQGKARFIGLLGALLMRVALLFSLTWVMGLTEPIISLFGKEFSGRDLILLIGGLFLIGKSTHEIHGSLEGEEGHGSRKVYAGFASVIVQIMLLDMVFSLDSVITAIGMVDEVWIMVAAVTVSIVAMMLFASPIGNFVERHPTVKLLSLAFLLLIGFTLTDESFHVEIPKGYIYAAMAFSVFVELLNMRLRKRGKPVNLHDAYSEADEAAARGE